MHYPTGPVRLRPSDIPGYSSSDPKQDGEAETLDAWGWWKRDDGSGEYVGLKDGLAVMADAIRKAGGVDGVIGFSQGACAAAFVTSLLEAGRKETFDALVPKGGMAYPTSFLGEDGVSINLPLKFGVCYSGFSAPDELYRAFYEPKIRTPMLNVIGSLDSVVEESRCLSLADSCEEGSRRIVHHPGGHFVPIGKQMVQLLIGFIRDTSAEIVREEDEDAEDMDVPF